MQILFTQVGTILLVRLSGEIDHHSSETLRNKIDGELVKASVKNIVIDMSKVSFMDSSGIGVLLGRLKNAQKFGKELVISSPNAQIKKVLNITGLLKVIKIYDDNEEAVTHLKKLINGDVI